jgi:pimeloyl-ACP methyl ester carboxylesterase
MLRQRVNGYDISYIAVGEGIPLVCVHGTLGDLRVWSPVIGPLSQRHRVIAVSLRHFFPERWDGAGTDYKVTQHVADVVGFIEALGEGPVDLMGHSRGGHIAFRVAQERPELLRRLVLAEPVGDLDASLLPSSAPPPAQTIGARYSVTAERVAAGDIDGALRLFAENYDGPGGWERVSPTVRQTWRDNARTLIGQAGELRQPFTRADTEAIVVPTLIIIGADTPGELPSMSRALAAHVRGSRIEMIPNARHFMFEDDPVRFCAAVLEFLAG